MKLLEALGLHLKKIPAREWKAKRIHEEIVLFMKTHRIIKQLK